MPTSDFRWHWTDDLARTLTQAGRETSATVRRWMLEPVAVRREGEAMAVAEALLVEESDEVHKAA
jgi:hypothetical protein